MDHLNIRLWNGYHHHYAIAIALCLRWKTFNICRIDGKQFNRVYWHICNLQAIARFDYYYLFHVKQYLLINHVYACWYFVVCIQWTWAHFIFNGMLCENAITNIQYNKYWVLLISINLIIELLCIHSWANTREAMCAFDENAFHHQLHKQQILDNINKFIFHSISLQPIFIFLFQFHSFCSVFSFVFFVFFSFNSSRNGSDEAFKYLC